MDWPTILDILYGLAIVAIPAYFAWRGKLSDNADDLFRSKAEFYSTLDKIVEDRVRLLQDTVNELLAENLGLKTRLGKQEIENGALFDRIRAQEKRNLALEAEINQLSRYASEQEGKIAQLTASNAAQLESLRSDVERARLRERTLERKLAALKEKYELDTGELGLD